MKLLIYSLIFCIVVFLFILSFDDKGKHNQPSEFDKMGATMMSDFNGAEMPDATQMQKNAQIQTAQEQGTTVLDEADSEFVKIMHGLNAALHQCFETVKAYTKESAYTLAGDLAEVVSPTNMQNKSAHSSDMETEKAENEQPIENADNETDNKESLNTETLNTEVVNAENLNPNNLNTKTGQPLEEIPLNAVKETK